MISPFADETEYQPLKLATPLPTRIIKPPVQRKIQGKRGTYRAMFLACDDGKEYLLYDLSVLIGFRNEHGLGQRINRYGWEDERILFPPANRGKTVEGGAPGEKKGGYGGEWRNMGNRERKNKLREIPAVGLLEEKYL